MFAEPPPSALVRREVAARLRHELTAGAVAPGARLESIRTLARVHGVSYVTMRAALLDLQHEGLVTLKRGSGVYAGTADAAAAGAGSGAGTAQRHVLAVLPGWFLEGRGGAVVGGILRGLLAPLPREAWSVELLRDPTLHGLNARLSDRMLRVPPDGVAWIRPYVGHFVHIVRLMDRGIPVCTCGRGFPDSGAPNVCYPLEDAATQAMDRFAADGEPVAVLANTATESYGDPQAIALLRAMDHALGRQGRRLAGERVLTITPPTAPETQEATRGFLRDCRDVRVFVCQYQHHIRQLAYLLQRGCFPEPERLTVVDLNLHHDVAIDELAGARYVRAVFDPAAEGQGMARHLEKALAGASSIPEPDLSVRLVEMAPGARE